MESGTAGVLQDFGTATLFLPPKGIAEKAGTKLVGPLSLHLSLGGSRRIRESTKKKKKKRAHEGDLLAHRARPLPSPFDRHICIPLIKKTFSIELLVIIIASSFLLGGFFIISLFDL